MTFIVSSNDELKPVERNLTEHLTNEHLYLREDGRLTPEVLEPNAAFCDEAFYRIARNLRIPGGTDEIQRVNIAKALGL